MTHPTLQVAAVLGAVLIQVLPVMAQNVQTVQPILLEPASQCCVSPAAAASQMAALPSGNHTYVAPEKRDPLRVVPTASQLKPLPSVAPFQGYGSRSACGPQIGTTRPCTLAPPATVARSTTVGEVQLPPPTAVHVLRPPVCAPAAATLVPEGYVIGKGLIGQPKLYKPGQPIRNFLRFITL